MDCEKCVANCSCKGHPMTVANCTRFDDGRGESCKKCITNCPLRQQDAEGSCGDFKDGEPEQGIETDHQPTRTQCMGMVMYEPPPSPPPPPTPGEITDDT